MFIYYVRCFVFLELPPDVKCMISQGIAGFKPIKLPPKIDAGDNA